MTALAFLLAMGLLVLAHELGHYLAAKLFGVRVLRFAIGLGRPFWIFKPHQTEWALCPIPLGGYVKLLGDTNETLKARDKPFAFSTQALFKRAIIIASGPLASLLVAALLQGLVLFHGEEEVKPLVGTVLAQTPAALAGFIPGERILSVNEVPVKHWQGIQEAFVAADPQQSIKVLVENEQHQLSLRTIRPHPSLEGSLPVVDTHQMGLLAERMMPVVGFLDPKGAAIKAGLAVGDQLLFVDDKPINTWPQFVLIVKNHPGKLLKITLKRGKQKHQFWVRPDTVEEAGFAVGKIGLMGQVDPLWHKKIMRVYYPSLGKAFMEGSQTTLTSILVTMRLLGRAFLSGSLTSHIAGPLTIAQLAGQTASLGGLVYLKFLAWISMSLGVLNLLPIPLLDGGRLLYCGLEWIKGKPLSLRLQKKLNAAGMVFLFFMLLIALWNDFRFFLG